MSMFSDYKAEREGKSMIESDHGFAIYSFHDDCCYIADIYVVPSHRRTGLGSQMADQIAGLAKEKKCRKLLGSVSASANGCHDSLLALLAYGFRLHSNSGDLIFFAKDL